MKLRFSYVLALLGAVLVLTVLSGCGQGVSPDNTTGGVTPTPTPGPGGPTPTPTFAPTGIPTPTSAPPPTDELAIVNTGIPVHFQARIAAGDDIIVYGTGAANGVAWIQPSAGDLTGRAIPNGDTFSSQAFAVAGKKIALVSNSQVTIFNTVDNSSHTISADQISLSKSLPAGVYTPGHIQADGNYIAVLNDPATLSDTKVIDVSGDVPVVLSFPAGSASQVAVDGTAKYVAVQAGAVYIFNILNPTKNPALSYFSSDLQMILQGGKILYSAGNVHLRDLGKGTDVAMNDNPAFEVSAALRGGKFAYFLANDTINVNHRSVIGSVTDAPNGLAAAKGVRIDSSSDAHGWVGYGSTAAITPDGSKILIAGLEAINSGEYLQVSAGGAFAVLKSATGGDAWGFPASDVTCSSNTVAFKGGSGQNTVVCHIRLP